MKSLTESITKICDKQNDQDEFNAEVLLNQTELNLKISNLETKIDDLDVVLSEILLNQMEG